MARKFTHGQGSTPTPVENTSTTSSASTSNLEVQDDKTVTSNNHQPSPTIVNGTVSNNVCQITNWDEYHSGEDSDNTTGLTSSSAASPVNRSRGAIRKIPLNNTNSSNEDVVPQDGSGDHQPISQDTSTLGSGAIPKIRRKSSVALSEPHNHLISDDVDSARIAANNAGMEGGIIDETRQILVGFVRGKIMDCGITPPECLESPRNDGHQRNSRRNNTLRSVGRDLRNLADSFEMSAQRQEVKTHAESVDFETLNFTNFSSMLHSFFFADGRGITQERIIVLFVFCADVGITALRNYSNNNTIFHRLIEYAVRFFAETICSWVQAHGGWVKVLQTSIQLAYKLAAIAFFTVATFACIKYLMSKK